MFRKYSKPEKVGWLGWFEDADGNTIAFVDLKHHVTFMDEIGL